jgi:hypothetical protein
MAKKLYIIGASAAGPLKIGIGRDPSRRLRELQTGNPKRLRVLYARTSLSNAASAESLTHQRLRALRILGEWFDVSLPEAISAIEAVADSTITEQSNGYKTIFVGVRFTPSLVVRLKDYMERNAIASLSGAVRALIESGLDGT